MRDKRILGTTPRARRRARKNPGVNPSQAVLNQRMKEIWSDGYGIMPYSTAPGALPKLRAALRAVAEDDRYWEQMERLFALKRSLADLMSEMKK